MTEQKEDFYISAIMDNIILDKEEYHQLRLEIKNLRKQVNIYKELLDMIIWN